MKFYSTFSRVDHCRNEMLSQNYISKSYIISEQYNGETKQKKKVNLIQNTVQSKKHNVQVNMNSIVLK